MQELAELPTMSMATSSREQRHLRATQVLASPFPSPSKAIEMAKTLLDGFPNAKPLSLEGYLKALAGTLAQYPADLSLECADPRTGIARTFDGWAPNVSHVIAWCDQ